MAKFVIDASLAAAWCFPDEQTDYTNGILKRIGRDLEPIAPVLWAYEIRNAVLMGLRRGRISRDGALKLLRFLEDLDVQLAEPPSYDVVFSLADSHRLTLYDAAYLDLAVREGASIASLDSALRAAAAKVGVNTA